MDEARLRRLLDVGRSLISELEPETVLQRLLDVARELTGARYAAIGVMDERREGLERFLTVGIDEETHRQIGDLPRGRGVLGVLITDPQPLRLADVSAHPRSYGFPLAHPPMTTFLGVPIVIEGEAWGNLYLTEKHGGEEFTDDDEEAAIVLAGWASIAIANARLYRAVSERRDELE
jgi:GAF domain-containing protein